MIIIIATTILSVLCLYRLVYGLLHLDGVEFLLIVARMTLTQAASLLLYPDTNMKESLSVSVIMIAYANSKVVYSCASRRRNGCLIAAPLFRQEIHVIALRTRRFRNGQG